MAEYKYNTYEDYLLAIAWDGVVKWHRRTAEVERLVGPTAALDFAVLTASLAVKAALHG